MLIASSLELPHNESSCPQYELTLYLSSISTNLGLLLFEQRLSAAASDLKSASSDNHEECHFHCGTQEPILRANFEPFGLALHKIATLEDNLSTSSFLDQLLAETFKKIDDNLYKL